MSELEKSTSGGEPVSSGTDQQGEVKEASGSETNPAYEKLLKEKQNHAKANHSLKAQLEEAEAKLKDINEKDLMATQQHEKVIEIQKEEITKLRSEITESNQKIAAGKINSTILSELKKLGFEDNEANRELALRVIERNMVEIDPTTNVVVGADESAKAFHAKYSHLGVFGKNKPGVNVQAPGVNQTINNGKPLEKMSLKETEAHLKDTLGKAFGG